MKSSPFADNVPSVYSHCGFVSLSQFSCCVHCGFVCDEKRSTCVSCGHPNWACHLCGSVSKEKFLYTLEFEGIDNRLNIYACTDCYLAKSRGQAFDDFWERFL